MFRVFNKMEKLEWAREKLEWARDCRRHCPCGRRHLAGPCKGKPPRTQARHRARGWPSGVQFDRPHPCRPQPDEMKWSPDKAGGGRIGFNTHNEVKN